MAQPTIFIADRTPADRAALSEALQGSSYEVVGEASTGDEMMEAVELLKPWCVAVDLMLPGHKDRPGDGGVNAIRLLHEKFPKLKILVTHGMETVHLVMGAISAGAGMRVRKPYRKEQVLEALAKLATGQGGEEGVKQLGVRLKKALPVRYKGAAEGFFAKKREAMTTEVSETAVTMQTEEKLAKGTVLNVEVEMAGEAPLKAKCQAAKVEAVPGLARFDVELNILDLPPAERERWKAFMQRLMDRATKVVKK